MKINYTYGNRRKKIIVIFLAIVYFALSMTLSVVSRGSEGLVVYNGLSVQGVLCALQLFLALSMVAIEYNLGGILSLISVFMSIAAAMMNILMTNSIMSLPGIMSNVASIFAILIIRKRLKIESVKSLTDELTGISNRKHIVSYVNYLIRTRKAFYLIFFEIDNTKLINDLYGFAKCDSIIKELVDEWNRINPSDMALGRFSGAEFIAVIRKDKCPDIRVISDGLVDVTKRIAEQSITMRDTLSISIGVAECPLNDNRAINLISKADMAVREAHKQGKNICVAYRDAYEDEILREQYIETCIKDALAEKKFYMVYQPQYETGTKKIRGFESLIRMESNYKENLLPGDFIPVAEKSDLIIGIGEYVLKRVCTDFSQVVKKNPDIVVSVNISAKQLLSQNFVRIVEGVLEETDFNPNNLEIEITEYCMMDTAEDAIAIVNALKSKGIKFAMDDFGTGYSSLSYLSRIPIDLLKIDKSLIDEIKDGEIVQAICSMAHALSCDVIAEGVEEQYQLDILREKGCDFIQGYIWSRPVEYADAIRLLEN